MPVVLDVVFQATHSFFLAFATLACGPLLGMLLMFGVRENRSAVVAESATTGADAETSLTR